MNIIDIILLITIGICVGLSIRHMIRTRHTGACTGNCASCSHGGKCS